jgi:hypothetical protein
MGAQKQCGLWIQQRIAINLGDLNVHANRRGAATDAVLKIVKGKVRALPDGPLKSAEDQFFAQLLLIDEDDDCFHEGGFFRSAAFEPGLETVREADFFLLGMDVPQANGGEQNGAE